MRLLHVASMLTVVLLVGMATVQSPEAHAQTVVPFAPGVVAYTTSDPVNSDRLGLATDNGRYMIELGNGCEGIYAGMNVELLAAQGNMLAVVPSGESLTHVCVATIDARMSDVPCFQTDNLCDVAAETD